MAVNFTVSLRDLYNDVALTVVGSALQIDDYSNYITASETGHTQAGFDFKYISVRPYGSSTRYEMCTVAGFDEVIAAPTTYGTTPEQSNYTFLSDAIYEVELISIPTYQKVTYTNTAYVIGSGNIYKSLKNSNTDVPSVTTSWELIGTTSDRTGYENISLKYRVVGYKEVVANNEECWASVATQVICEELNVDCNDVELCSNKLWRNAMRMTMILEVIPVMVDNLQLNEANELIKELSNICDCCE